MSSVLEEPKSLNSNKELHKRDGQSGSFSTPMNPNKERNSNGSSGKSSCNLSNNKTPKHDFKKEKELSFSNGKEINKKLKTEPQESSSPIQVKSSKNDSLTVSPKKIKQEKEVINSNSSKKQSSNNGSSQLKQSKSMSSIKSEIKNELKTPTKTSTPSNSKKRAAEIDVSQSESPKKRKKKEEEEEVWKWWEEKKYEDGRKWTTLEHKGPVFDPGYTPLPDNVPFYYNSEKVRLCPESEEVMTFYARMLDHDYTKKDVFNNNFFNDWRKFMTDAEKTKIRDLKKCDFSHVYEYFKKKSEERKAMSKEEKKALKEESAKIKKDYGFCIWDGHKQPIGNYKIEPPGLFRGRGEHPKMGMVKRRTRPEDVIINCGKDSKIPSPPVGHKWKEVRHDNMVAWLASWTENVQGNTKYVMLNAASRVKGERDWQKYEKARKLHRYIDKIRANYIEDWKSKEMKVRQRAVAIYFIDKLALRAGNEKDEDEADTVGCCSLRVEHIKLHKDVEGVGEYVVEFDFLGKDSIRYQNKVAVEKQVYKNLLLFMENKNPDDELFDRLNTTILNTYLNEIMDGLSAKVFRTYNASRTLQEQLDKLTNTKDSVNDKILSYNRANRAVAILCNHQRAVPKTFAKSMENMQAKIQAKKDQIKEAELDLKKAKTDYKNLKTVTAKKKYETKEKQLEKLRDGLRKMEIQVTDKEENKDIALGTSKLNYLDPRISVAWCKKNNVPVEKIYSKTQRDKFRWAIDMATADFHFFNYEGEIVLRDLSHLEGMAVNTTQESQEDGDQDETQDGEDEDDED